ncbi:uncharacterized protein LOC124449235 [Xenia sp. Carnegie-2017]|uniref:uncharacterized protein LOC124449235 n=1 Tax=Xenia sp. Carnegie-2017 TaxID=2897299 RepID=UPI001F04448D|nr:uncharacterized protein LOC124449235 [Xenia sp. Carnegie-2017]
MDTDYSNDSSSNYSGSSVSHYEEMVNDQNMIQPYAYEPIETDSSDEPMDDSDEVAAASSTESVSEPNRLQDKFWCTCSHCQIMDRVEECVCCKEISAVVTMNEDSAQFEGIDTPDCITDNPVFQIFV